MVETLLGSKWCRAEDFPIERLVRGIVEPHTDDQEITIKRIGGNEVQISWRQFDGESWQFYRYTCTCRMWRDAVYQNFF